MPMAKNKIPSRFLYRPQRQWKRLGAATGASRRSRTGFPVRNNLFNVDSLRRRLSTEGRGSGLGSAPLCNPKFATTGDSAPPSVPVDKILSKAVLSASATKEVKKDDKFEFFKGRPFVDRNDKKKVKRNLFQDNLCLSNNGRSGFDNLGLTRYQGLKMEELSSSAPGNLDNRRHMVEDLELQARDEEESKLKVCNWISSQHFKENLECSLSSSPDKDHLGEESPSNNMMESHERSFVDFHRSVKSSWAGSNDGGKIDFMEEEVDILELGHKVSEVRPWQGQNSVGLDTYNERKVRVGRSVFDPACDAGRDPWQDPLMQSVWDASPLQPRFLEPRVMW